MRMFFGIKTWKGEIVCHYLKNESGRYPKCVHLPDGVLIEPCLYDFVVSIDEDFTCYVIGWKPMQATLAIATYNLRNPKFAADDNVPPTSPAYWVDIQYREQLLYKIIETAYEVMSSSLTVTLA